MSPQEEELMFEMMTNQIVNSLSLDLLITAILTTLEDSQLASMHDFIDTFYYKTKNACIFGSKSISELDESFSRALKTIESARGFI